MTEFPSLVVIANGKIIALLEKKFVMPLLSINERSCMQVLRRCNKHRFSVHCKSAAERIEAIELLRSLGYQWHYGSPAHHENATGVQAEKYYPFAKWPTIGASWTSREKVGMINGMQEGYKNILEIDQLKQIVKARQHSLNTTKEVV